MNLQDCPDSPSTRSLGDYSAFGNNNVMRGPFYDPGQAPKLSSSRSRTRDWEQGGTGPPDRVGRQARMKSMAALEKKSRQAEDDPDDWFGSNFSKSSRAPHRPPREPKKISFGKSFNDERQYASSANRPPSLLTRLANDYNHSNSRLHDINRQDEGRRSRKPRSKNDNRRQREDRSGSSAFVDGPQQDIPTGPRYRGGYAR